MKRFGISGLEDAAWEWTRRSVYRITTVWGELSDRWSSHADQRWGRLRCHPLSGLSPLTNAQR